MEATQVTIITVPASEWNAMNATLKDIADKVNQLTNKDEKELLTPKVRY